MEEHCIMIGNRILDKAIRYNKLLEIEREAIRKHDTQWQSSINEEFKTLEFDIVGLAIEMTKFKCIVKSGD